MDKYFMQAIPLIKLIRLIALINLCDSKEFLDFSFSNHRVHTVIT